MHKNIFFHATQEKVKRVSLQKINSQHWAIKITKNKKYIYKTWYCTKNSFNTCS